ncbi:phosphoenolpyruvate carboxykinase (ATP) [Parafilimonas sp.]|uniref:phosphoenolpyruvate carboxykinase (ATP) n=1 Tax=Parafilimonas sp. TaxID=1969739 RepID=UPI0039E67383
MAVETAFIPTAQLKKIGLSAPCIHYQLSPDELTEQTLQRREGVINNTGALCVLTGAFTGRSPKDRFFVADAVTKNSIDWNDFNIAIDEKYFAQLKEKLTRHLNAQKEVWVRDCYACADESYSLPIRIINENPWSNLFAHNMFIRPTEAELETFRPGWLILQAPSFKANPKTDGTRQENFAIISFTHKMVLIGGTGYTGEIKKGIFSILNYLLPHNKQVLSMHCSANVGRQGDVAVFFGLSGTGKTTLSTDSERELIGDDEHGWTNTGVFNFEGGCYAKCIDLSEEKEPGIFHAVKPGALVENVTFFEGTNEIDFSDTKITENTRVSYPLGFISNAVHSGIGGTPKNIFFLTCDAYCVLPPISLLTPGQAMYQFLSGYTAKVAGTEEGVTEPKVTFSTCFGAPFLPLHPSVYAEMLGKKLKEHNVNVWMINTGWIGGPYSVGSRIKLSYTRAMICAALNGNLKKAAFEKHPVFGMMVPCTCPGVPQEILNTRNTWSDKNGYDKQANMLAGLFIKNFEKYAPKVSKEILNAAPVVV